MKVAGSGSPRTLTIRVQRSEIQLWQEALRQRLAAGSSTADRVIAHLLQCVHMPVQTEQPWILVGPTEVLGPIAHAVAGAAHDKYSRVWREFETIPDVERAERLRLALDTMSAATATVVALAKVRNDATLASAAPA